MGQRMVSRKASTRKSKERTCQSLRPTLKRSRAIARKEVSNLVPLPICNYTPAMANKDIAKITKQWPMLTYKEAVLLNIYRNTQDASTTVSNTSGGGRYHRYIEQLASKYDINLRF